MRTGIKLGFQEKTLTQLTVSGYYRPSNPFPCTVFTRLSFLSLPPYEVPALAAGTQVSEPTGLIIAFHSAREVKEQQFRDRNDRVIQAACADQSQQATTPRAWL
jgi:hypothetical protein